MSIKDWGAYSSSNPIIQSPNWDFGQEYPWDAILCRVTSSAYNPNPKKKHNNQINLLLPSVMRNRLWDGDILYPPSQLSMFGINIVMKALWMVSVDYDQKNASSIVKLDHNVNYYSASHSYDGKEVQVYMDEKATLIQCDEPEGNISETLDLLVMGLDTLSASDKSAIIGFIPKKFIVNPSSVTSLASI